MIIIGIDQGLSGAVAVVSDNSRMIYPTPIVAGKRKAYDENGMLRMLDNILREYGLHRSDSGIHAFIEAVQPMRDKPVMAAMSQGYGDGLWSMALTSTRIPRTHVNARKWQNVMFAGTPGTDTKQRSIQAAKRLCPGLSLRHSERCTVDNHNWSDALLIALFGLRQMGGCYECL